jgi:DNA-binding MurR/RpiR family transcriptional regulator
MSGALANVRSFYRRLPQAQRRVADCVLARQGEVPLLSVHRVAKLAGVSVASVSRFARELGYADFKAFKAQLGRETLTPFNRIYGAVAPADGEAAIVEKVFAGNIRSLQETLGALNRRDLGQAAAALARCRRLLFIGIGSSGQIARDAALRFSQLDLQAEGYSESYELLNQCVRTKRGDVVFGLSHSGRSAITVEGLRLAQRNGALTLGMSNYLRSPLHAASRLFFCTAFAETRVRAAALSSRVAQMCLLDALYLLVARRRKRRLATVDRLDRCVERTLRLSAS